jgi:hypothetical protein
VPKIVREALWGLVTVVIIMGGILSGVFTPTESARVACVYAFLVTFLVYRDLPLARAAAARASRGEDGRDGDDADRVLGRVRLHDGDHADPRQGDVLLPEHLENKYVFLLLVEHPAAAARDVHGSRADASDLHADLHAGDLKLGIDPVHFGMIMILNLGIGLITPPVGPTLFVGCAIGKVTMEQVSKELWPFYGAMCLALLIVTYVPAISLWLPGLMR